MKITSCIARAITQLTMLLCILILYSIPFHSIIILHYIILLLFYSIILYYIILYYIIIIIIYYGFFACLQTIIFHSLIESIQKYSADSIPTVHENGLCIIVDKEWISKKVKLGVVVVCLSFLTSYVSLTCPLKLLLILNSWYRNKNFALNTSQSPGT